MKKKKLMIIIGSIIGVLVIGFYAVQYIVFQNIDKIVPQDKVEQIGKLMEELQKSNTEELQKLAEKALEEELGNSLEAEQDIQGENKETEPQEETIEATSKETKVENKKESKVEKAKSQIPVVDQVKGLSIASKIDVGYLSSLSSGELTPEKKQKIKEHIYSRLTPGEVSEMFRLYGEYSHLLK